MASAARHCFALLDDCAATRERPTRRLYQGFEREHRCTDPSGLDTMWARVDADLRSGLHAVLLLDYEWGSKLLEAGHEQLGNADASALRVLMFGELSLLCEAEVSAWLAGREADPTAAAGVMHLTASVDPAAFTRAIARIHEAIGAGETYQVNYTYRLQGQAFGAPVALYRRLRARQPVCFGARIVMPERGESVATATHVLSCSPELFLQHSDGLLTARPMKGTAARAPGPESDSETARHLSIDIKNRAENLMIVDLLRNDLGRLARTGSVTVPALFAIESYSTVFQMTSTVQARLKPGLGMPEVLRATFPCGSITGAPKHHTMQLIAGLEATQRGLYCAAMLGFGFDRAAALDAVTARARGPWRRERRGACACGRLTTKVCAPPSAQGRSTACSSAPTAGWSRAAAVRSSSRSTAAGPRRRWPMARCRA